MPAMHPPCLPLQLWLTHQPISKPGFSPLPLNRQSTGPIPGPKILSQSKVQAKVSQTNTRPTWGWAWCSLETQVLDTVLQVHKGWNQWSGLHEWLWVFGFPIGELRCLLFGWYCLRQAGQAQNHWLWAPCQSLRGCCLV